MAAWLGKLLDQVRLRQPLTRDERYTTFPKLDAKATHPAMIRSGMKKFTRRVGAPR